MTDLYSFLEHTSSTSDFKADLSIRGGYITFSNSGRRGGVKYFQIGLDNILQTLKDIYENLNVFQFLTQYEETHGETMVLLYSRIPSPMQTQRYKLSPCFQRSVKL